MSARQWVLTEQPGREVTAVRDAEGDLWRRVESGVDAAHDLWQLDVVLPSLSWSQLLVDYGPLTDATDEARPESRPGGGVAGGIPPSPAAGGVVVPAHDPRAGAAAPADPSTVDGAL